MWELVFYTSYLVFPFLIMILFFMKKEYLFRWFFTILSIIFIYTRFIEPQIIVVNETNINLWFNANFALISDLHIWIYKKEDFVEKLVEKINKLDVEQVFIAWDLTLNPNKKNIEKLFLPLKKLNKPTYWVLWNHDVQKPGPNIRKELIETLDSYWLHFLNNKEVNLWEFKLLWLWSYWWLEDKVKLLDNYSLDDNIIVLTHNPDTTSKFTNENADLTLCWHTHWWQIRIPFLYKKVIPTEWDFDKWLTKEENTLLYTTSGVWETWLPMRLFNFPVIEVIKIY